MVPRIACGVLFIVGVVFSWDDDDPKPSFLTANVGEQVVFNCELDFPQDIPIPYILKWNKDGKSVFTWYEGILTAAEPFVGRINLAESTELVGDGSVSLTSIRESDQGWYQCRVLFPNRNPSSRNNGTWFYLTVTGGNLLEIPPINQTSLEGEEAKFSCAGKDKETAITWYKDGIPIKDLSDLRSRSFESDGGTLTIRNTLMSDLGEYECEALNTAGDKQSARAYLNVQFKARVIYAPKEVYFSYGRPAILDCHFRSNPPLNNLRWEKDGFLFDPYNVQGVFYKRNGSLFFSKVDEAHGGQYSCTPYNELGTDGPSPATRVIVQRPPVFIVTPNNLYLRKLGENIELPCDARDGDGGHKPTLVWYKKDGSPLPEGRYNIHGGNLTIVNIQEDDRGHYQCSASNQAAAITTEAELVVESIAPKAPFNLTANSSQSAVTLRWAAGYIRPQLEYSIWYRPVDTAEWRTMKIQSRKSSEATVLDLSPGREYEFMVLSQDKHGDGMFSKSIKIKTKGSGYYSSPEEIKSPEESFSPFGPPKNVTVHTTVEGYLVTWEAPDYGRDLVKIYVVKWSQGSTGDISGTAETNELFHNVQHLEEDTTYFFQVSSISDDYHMASDRVIIVVPAYRKIRAISISIMTIVAILGASFGAFYYLRKRCCKNYDEKKSCNSS